MPCCYYNDNDAATYAQQHCKPQYANTEQSCLQVRTRFPREAARQHAAKAGRSQRRAKTCTCTSIAILQRIDISRDEERTRACCLPAPASKYRSSSAAGGRAIQTATFSEEEELEGSIAPACSDESAWLTGRSLPDAAAAAALSSSAAARRIQRHAPHRRDTSGQPNQTQAVNLMKR